MREILASLLLYTSPLWLIAGLSSVSAASLVAALLIPPRRRGLAHAPVTEQDRQMPQWQFAEIHEAHVDAPAFRAALDTTADEILFYQTLTRIRRWFGNGGAQGESILNAAGNRPILESAEKGGFQRLAEIPGKEILLAANLGESIRVTMNFTFPDGHVRTETRVHALNARSRWLFAWYWRLIYPGSSLIRYMWLRAIRHRAEDNRAEDNR
jgi:hypothetical protein